MRSIGPGDRMLLMAAFERLSDESCYRRFLAHRSGFSETELDYLTAVDHRDHEALLAIDVASGTAVGVARYIRVGPRTAELAITVVDDWHRRGVGGLLLRRLARRAHRAASSASSPSRSPATSRRCGCCTALPTRRVAAPMRTCSSELASGAAVVASACGAAAAVRGSARRRR